jgi:alkylation response protein AidB-like acyl-CoA dehydrogenase
MLKVWSTERLWTIVNDAFQIHGGAAYFTDKPLERMLRDARINQIGEGANEVLTSFIALTGMRGPGMELKKVYDGIKQPWSNLGTVNRFLADWLRLRCSSPAVPVRSAQLQPVALRLGRLIRQFGAAVQNSLIRHREEVLERQLVHERIAWSAMELYAMACTLSRVDAELAAGKRGADPAGMLLLADAGRRADEWLRELRSNDDAVLLAAADKVVTT